MNRIIKRITNKCFYFNEFNFAVENREIPTDKYKVIQNVENEIQFEFSLVMYSVDNLYIASIDVYKEIIDVIPNTMGGKDYIYYENELTGKENELEQIAIEELKNYKEYRKNKKTERKTFKWWRNT